MGREAIKLTPEKHGKAIRYRKMFKGTVWISPTYHQETRENKREAWQEFCAWRDEQIAQPQPVTDDQHGLIRQMCAQQVQVLVDHAELTGDPAQAKRWRIVLADIPNFDRETLYELTASLVGEVNGVSQRPVIEDRAKTVERIKQQTDTDLTSRKLADEYTERLKKKAEAKRGSYGHYGQVKTALDRFVNWYGPKRSLTRINEKIVRDYTAELEDQIDRREISRNTAHDYQQKFRTFIGQLVDDYPEDIPLPKNLRSKRQLIPTERKEPVVFTLDEVKLMLDNAVPRTKLFFLLLLNCAMYQGDISDLNDKEIDWQSGRIIRPRSKTARLTLARGTSQPIKVNWYLWRETWKLFQQFGKREGLCFQTQNGTDLITHTLSSRNDSIRSLYRRVISKLKRHNKLPAEWNKTPKDFRKTGANLLEKSKEHGQFYSLYLNHSVAKQHYLSSGDPVPSFDSAVRWIGQRIGVE